MLLHVDMDRTAMGIILLEDENDTRRPPSEASSK
jgi:hypothetical protein